MTAADGAADSRRQRREVAQAELRRAGAQHDQHADEADQIAAPRRRRTRSPRIGIDRMVISSGEAKRIA